MIQGTAKIQVSFATLRSCSAAQVYNRDATARNPVWHPTNVEFFDGGIGGTGMVVGARVTNYFSVVEGGTVKFTAANGTTCTGTTNAEGIASCTMRAPAGDVVAEFEAKASTDIVELSSSATKTVR